MRSLDPSLKTTVIQGGGLNLPPCIIFELARAPSEYSSWLGARPEGMNDMSVYRMVDFQLLIAFIKGAS